MSTKFRNTSMYAAYKRFICAVLACALVMSTFFTGDAIVMAQESEGVETAQIATETDAEALDEAQEVVYDESKVDEDGFVWDGTTLVKYVGKGGDVKIPEGCTSIGGYYAEGDGSFLGAFLDVAV